MKKKYILSSAFTFFPIGLMQMAKGITG